MKTPYQIEEVYREMDEVEQDIKSAERWLQYLRRRKEILQTKLKVERKKVSESGIKY